MEQKNILTYIMTVSRMGSYCRFDARVAMDKVDCTPGKAAGTGELGALVQELVTTRAVLLERMTRLSPLFGSWIGTNRTYVVGPCGQCE